MRAHTSCSVDWSEAAAVYGRGGHKARRHAPRLGGIGALCEASGAHSRGVFWLAALIVLGSSLAATTAAAERRFAVQASVAEGVAIGDAGDAMIVRRAPMFADLSIATWSTDDPDWWVGGGIRMEFESQTSFGASVRVGLNANLEILTVRPYVGVAAILAPLTLFGAEVGVDLSVQLVDSFRLLGRVFGDGYFLGDDLPQGSVLITFSGALGVEVVF